MKKFPSISVVGLGTIGLPIAASFAATGRMVYGVDNNPRVLQVLDSMQIDQRHMEPQLAALVSKVIRSGHLTVSSRPKHSDVFIIATPSMLDDAMMPITSQITEAIDSITPFLVAGNSVVIESTVPIGMCEQMRSRIKERRADLFGTDDQACAIYIASVPEHSAPGSLIEEMTTFPRVVGGHCPACTRHVAAIYRETFPSSNVSESIAVIAEASKLCENVFRAVNIALANELAEFLTRSNVSSEEVFRFANQHPRVSIHDPGCGVGGTCIPDATHLLTAGKLSEYSLLDVATRSNRNQPELVAKRIDRYATQNKIRQLTLLGVTYKANCSILRHSPAIRIANMLARWGKYEILAFDPNVICRPDELDSRIKWCSAPKDIESSDLFAMLVPHAQFKELSHRSCALNVRGDLVSATSTKCVTGDRSD